jgi:hypothetical protein
VVIMATSAKPNTKRGKLTSLLRKNLLQIPKSCAVYSGLGRFLQAVPGHPTVSVKAMVACDEQISQGLLPRE